MCERMQLCDLCEVSQSRPNAQVCRASKILRMEGQIEMWECTPSKCRQLAATSLSILYVTGIACRYSELHALSLPLTAYYQAVANTQEPCFNNQPHGSRLTYLLFRLSKLSYKNHGSLSNDGNHTFYISDLFRPKLI